LAVAAGLSAAVSFFFLGPLAALVPVVLPLVALLQPKLPDAGKRIVKWLIWILAIGWTQGIVVLSFLLLRYLPPQRHDLVVLRVSSLVSALLILWLDIELIADAVRRVRILRSPPRQEPRPVGLGLWIFAAALNLWMGWGLVSVIGIYRAIAGQAYSLVLSMIEAAIVLVFDAYLVWRVLRRRRGQNANSWKENAAQKLKGP
jgi:hypothetical protein